MDERSKQTILIAGTIGLMALGGVISFMMGPGSSKAATGMTPPATVTINAIIRDFKGYDLTGGHPDFEQYNGARIKLAQLDLDGAGKPVFNSSYGESPAGPFTDSAGRNIGWMIHDPMMGDPTAPVVTVPVSDPTNVRMTSQESFAQWYRNTQGVNLSKVVPITLVYNNLTGNYVFDSATHEPYVSIGGFFPIDDDLFGNYMPYNDGIHNFHFTTEIDTTFTYDEGAQQVFTFTGDDDVWVFINDKMVIDLGGIHGVQSQTIELNRLDWLTHGQEYSLRIFHAERHITASNFRMETTIQLRSAEMPQTDWTYD